MILIVAGFEFHLMDVLSSGLLLTVFTGGLLDHDVLNVVLDRVQGLQSFNLHWLLNLRCARRVIIVTSTVVAIFEVQQGQLSANPTLKDVDV